MLKQILAIWLLMLTVAWLPRCRAETDPVELSDRLQLADGLFRRSLFELATREYQALAQNETLRSEPLKDEADGILFRLAECLRRLKRSEEAVAAYGRLVQEYPRSRYAQRAELQRALIRMEGREDALAEALAAFEKLGAADIAPEVRGAALYHGAQTLEKMGREREAINRYKTLVHDFVDSDYGTYGGLRLAWLLTQSGAPQERAQALGIYLDLAYKAKDQRVAEDATYFAAQVALMEERYENSARLFSALREKFPGSKRVGEGALAAAWANYYSGLYKESIAWIDMAIAQPGQSERENLLYVKANALRHLERRGEAAAIYQQQLQDFPEGTLAGKARYERLSVLYSDGKYKEVLEAAAGMREVAAEYADNIYWMSAESAMALSEKQEAIQYYRLLVDKCRESPFVKDALYRLGWMLQKQEAWESAASWYQQVVERFPDDPRASQALYASGVCRAQLGQGDLALRDWTALLTRYPASAEVAEALYQKAMEELRAKNPRAAGATLSERVRRFPKDERRAEVLFWRAVVARQTGEKVEAEALFRESLTADLPKEYEREATLELGVLLYEGGQRDEAAKLFQGLLDAPIADKMGADRLAWLAEFQLERGQHEAATKAARALLALQPDRGWQQSAWTLLGKVHVARGERDPARHALQEALATGATTAFGAEAALLLGELLSEAGNYAEARTRLEEAARRAAVPELLTLRARAYEALGRNGEKRGDLEEALRFYISVGLLFDDATLVPQSLAKAAEITRRLGREDEADTMRRELRERYPDWTKEGEAK